MKLPVNTHLGYSLRRYFVDQFFLEQIPPLLNGTHVLDVGGQKTTKRGQFDIRAYDLDVVYANISTQKGTDVVADAHLMPFMDASFETAVCAELLEHVYQPQQVLQEIYRTLKPQGRLLATVPFLFHIHADPHDYGRYTHHYWHTVMSDIGFTDIQIKRQGLYYAVKSNMFEQYINHIRIRPFTRPFRWFTFHFMVAPMKKWALWRESKPSVQQSDFYKSYTTGFSLYGVKPA